MGILFFYLKTCSALLPPEESSRSILSAKWNVVLEKVEDVLTSAGLADPKVREIGEGEGERKGQDDDEDGEGVKKEGEKEKGKKSKGEGDSEKRDGEKKSNKDPLLSYKYYYDCK